MENKTNGIYKKIPLAMSKIGAIGKNGENKTQNYKFRSIDDMYNSIQPVLAEIGLFFVPTVLETKEDIFESVKKDQYGEKTTRSIRVKQKIKYTIYSDDGSFMETVIEGEAIDTSDKATNKAMTAAFKYMLIQVFCIAIKDQDDADSQTPEIPERKSLTKTFEENKAKQNLPKKPEDFFINVGKNKGKKIGDLDKKQIEDMLITMNAYYSKEENKKDLKAAQPLIDAANDHLMSLIEQEQKQNFNNI